MDKLTGVYKTSIYKSVREGGPLMRCECGADVNKRARFCPSCGKQQAIIKTQPYENHE